MAAVDRAVMRLEGDGRALSDRAVIDALNETVCEEVISDPVAVHHETVPYEKIIACGPESFAESLRETLPKYFAPLVYRPLDFRIEHVEADAPSVLFGDLFEPGLGSECGQAILTLRQDGAPNLTEVFALRRGQGRLVLGLSDDPIAAGLPAPKVMPKSDLEGSLLTVVPGAQGPRVELRLLREKMLHIGVSALTGEKSAGVTVEHTPDHGSYFAQVDGGHASLRIIPDTSFSRPVSAPRHDVDQLEVLGVFVPNPAMMPVVAGVAVRFSQNTQLSYDSFQKETGRVVLVGQHDRHVLFSEGAALALDRRGHVPQMSLRFLPRDGGRYELSSAWGLLGSQDDAPIARIPLRLADPGECSALQVSRSVLRYKRPRLVMARDTSEDGAAIYLDWLDDAVKIMLADAEKGVVEQGLAEFASRQGEMFQGILTGRRGVLQWGRTDAQNQDLRDGATFRMGPLLVRLRMRSQEAAGGLPYAQNGVSP